MFKVHIFTNHTVREEQQLSAHSNAYCEKGESQTRRLTTRKARVNLLTAGASTVAEKANVE